VKLKDRRWPWKILRQGRAWEPEEMRARLALRPEKLEVVRGKLLWSDQERIALLAMLLENVGIDEAVRLAPRETWLAALGIEDQGLA